MKKKKGIIKEEPEEIEEDIELKENDYLREQDKLFYQIIEESYKQILKHIKEGDMYKVQDYVGLLESLDRPDYKKEFRIVMDVLDKISLKRY